MGGFLSIFVYQLFDCIITIKLNTFYSDPFTISIQNIALSVQCQPIIGCRFTTQNPSQIHITHTFEKAKKNLRCDYCAEHDIFRYCHIIFRHFALMTSTKFNSLRFFDFYSLFPIFSWRFFRSFSFFNTLPPTFVLIFLFPCRPIFSFEFCRILSHFGLFIRLHPILISLHFRSTYFRSSLIILFSSLSIPPLSFT